MGWGCTQPTNPCASGSCHPGYGYGTPVPYYQGGGYPMGGYGGYDPSFAGMAPQGYGGYANMGGQPAQYAGGGMNAMPYGQPAPVNGGAGNQIPSAARTVTAIAK